MNRYLASSLRTREVIDKCFVDLALAVPSVVIPENGDFEKKFLALKSSCEDKTTRNLVIATVKSQLMFYETYLNGFDAESAKPREVIVEAFRMFFNFAVNAYIDPFKDASNVVKQHWIPWCFIKRFSESFQRKTAENDRKRRRSAFVVESRRDVNGDVERVDISDSYFCHMTPKYKKEYENKPFYHSSLECFFNFLESRYGSVVEKVEQNDDCMTILDLVSAYAFGVSLELRKPNRDGLFTGFNIPEFIELMCDKADNESHTFVKFSHNSENLVFSGVSGEAGVDDTNYFAEIYPLSTALTLVVSDVVLSDDEASGFVVKNQESLVSKMIDGELSLFGLPLDIRYGKMQIGVPELSIRVPEVKDSAFRLFNRKFNNLAETIGIRLHGESLRERVETLSSECDSDVDVAWQVQELSKESHKALRRDLRSLKMGEGLVVDDLDEKIVDILFTLMIGAVAVPKDCAVGGSQHHFIPSCFMRQWSRLPARAGYRKGFHQIDFSSGEADVSLVDIYVASYEKDGDAFFYPDDLRGLFFELETWYGDIASEVNGIFSRLNENDKNSIAFLSTFSLILMYLFSVMVDLRKPDENGEFTIFSVGDFLEAFCKNLDENPVGWLRFDFSGKKNFFTLEREGRSFVNRYGARIQVRTVTPLFTLVSANRELTMNEVRASADRHRKIAVDNFKNGKLILYGVTEDEI